MQYMLKTVCTAASQKLTDQRRYIREFHVVQKLVLVSQSIFLSSLSRITLRDT